MSLTDPIGDMLTRIRNAQMRRRDTVATPASTMRGRVLDVLKSEGFIRGYTEQKTDNGLNEYEIELNTSDKGFNFHGHEGNLDLRAMNGRELTVHIQLDGMGTGPAGRLPLPRAG